MATTQAATCSARSTCTVPSPRASPQSRHSRVAELPSSMALSRRTCGQRSAARMYACSDVDRRFDDHPQNGKHLEPHACTHLGRSISLHTHWSCSPLLQDLHVICTVDLTPACFLSGQDCTPLFF